MEDLPFIDPRVELVGIGKLRSFTTTALKDLKTVVVILGKSNQPIGVLLTYEHYLALQNKLKELQNGARSC